MRELPEWIIKYDEMTSCCTNISDYKKLYEALKIAWKNLNLISEERTENMKNYTFAAVIALDTMRRIEELGETKYHD